VLDAKAFSRPEELQGPGATTTKALDLIAEAASSLAPDGHFVFVFAGHGRHEGPDGFACLLHDKPLWREELWQALSAFTVDQRITLVIDSCYAAGMSPASFTSWARDVSPPVAGAGTPPVKGHVLIAATARNGIFFPTAKTRFAKELEKQVIGRKPADDHRSLQTSLKRSLPSHQNPTLVVDPPGLWDEKPFGDGVGRRVTAPVQGHLERILSALRAVVG
jgi:hypothetical protein